MLRITILSTAEKVPGEETDYLWNLVDEVSGNVLGGVNIGNAQQMIGFLNALRDNTILQYYNARIAEDAEREAKAGASGEPGATAIGEEELRADLAAIQSAWGQAEVLANGLGAESTVVFTSTNGQSLSAVVEGELIGGAEAEGASLIAILEDIATTAIV